MKYKVSPELTMINSQIITKINQSLNIGNQVASVSHSSLLTSHVEFMASDSEHSRTVHSLQKKYHQLGTSQETHVNGQFKHASKAVKVNQENRINEDSNKSETGMPVPRVTLYNPGRVQLDWKQSSKIGAGLVNLGNTCFMNTVIQCLTYCTPLANYLLNDEDHSVKCKISGFCMLCEMQKHMKRALDRHGQAIKPMYIYQKLKSIAKHFQFGRQEDAHEFLRYVIDNLWKACLSNYEGGFRLDPASKETTVVNQIFGGYNRSQVVCLRCHGKSNTFDHFMDLILDIKQNVSSLQSALEKFVQAEMLEDDNAYKCPKCCMKVRAEKKFTVHKPPNVATFQFKRFDYNRMFGGKITKNISYPEKLDLRPYMSETQGPSVMYKLNSVLVHMGHTCNSGHYYCFVRNSNGCWYLMDDTRVHQVSLDQVLQQQAYVLFYVRVPSHPKDSLKKPLQSLPLNKVMTPVRNGPIDQSSDSTRSSYASRPSSLTQNGTSKQSSFKLCRNSPLLGQQPREKISFGIRRTTPTTNGLSSSKASNDRTRPVADASASHAKTLVPYGGDSSDSSDDEKSHEIANGRLKNGDSTMNLQEIPLPSESVASVDESGPPKEALEHRNRCERLVPKVGLGMNSPSMLRSRGTVNWNVVDSNLQSPSVASGSSNNSINSTTDWSVMDHDSTPKSKERAYVGWSVHSKQSADKSSESVASCTGVVNGDRSVSPARTNLFNGSASVNGKLDHCGNDNNQERAEKSVVNGDVECSDAGKSLHQVDEQGERDNTIKHQDTERKRSWAKPSEDTSFSHKRFKDGRYNQDNDRRYGGRTSQNGWDFNNRCPRKPNGYHFYGYENEQQRRFKDGRHRNRHSSGTSNSSYETEWIEKTKETVDKERRPFYHGEPMKYWVGDGRGDERRRDRGQYKGSQHWNGSRNSDTVNELLRMSGQGYGNGVCSWDGSRSYMNEDLTRKWHYSDDYDEEYDKGKMRKERKRYSDPYPTSAGNPFQRIQNMKGNGRPYGNFHSFQAKHNWNHSQDKYYGNRNRSYGPPRIHRYYN